MACGARSRLPRVWACGLCGRAAEQSSVVRVCLCSQENLPFRMGLVCEWVGRASWAGMSGCYLEAAFLDAEGRRVMRAVHRASRGQRCGCVGHPELQAQTMAGPERRELARKAAIGPWPGP